MSDKKPEHIDGVGWRYEHIHSMKRRMLEHDYHGRSIYMLTLCIEGRSALLGTLRYEAGKEEEAYIEPTALGKDVENCWEAIPSFYPEVKVLAFQLMPDHVHGLLFVTKEQEAHLGKIVNGFKIGCNKALRKLRAEGAGSTGSTSSTTPTNPEAEHPGGKRPEPLRPEVECHEAVCPEVECHEAVCPEVECHEAVPRETKQPAGNSPSLPHLPPHPNRSKHPEKGMLFETGYQDSVLKGKDQLERMFNYITDNPKRLAIKRQNPELFRVVSSLTVNGQSFAAIGNRWLLDRPIRMQVRCHNNTSPENLRLIEKQKDYFLVRGKSGGVVVSPCISAGEKEIARAALDAMQPLIVILENGFPPMYKPPGKYFDACANGLLLMLAPWPYHMENRTITRQQCLALNDMAKDICTDPWTEELELRLSSTP